MSIHKTAEEKRLISELKKVSALTVKQERENKKLKADNARMLKSLKGVDNVIKEVFKECGKITGVTNWGVVNDGLCEVTAAISQAEKK